MTEKQFIIPQSMVSGLLAYLQKKPYEEVAQAIPALMRLPEHGAPEKRIPVLPNDDEAPSNI